MDVVLNPKNGNNSPSPRGNDKRFAKFRREVSEEARSPELLCYSTEWCDALCHRIATGDLIEATLAWTNYRANGNSSRRAVHLYSRRGEEPEETPLRQTDAALEIAWLRAGHPREWLDAPLEIFRQEAESRGVVPTAKTLISDAFTFNRIRGTIYPNTGQQISPVPTPKVADSPEFRERKGERSLEFQAYLEEWKVAHSAEFQELEVARSTVKRITKVLLAGYKTHRKSATHRTNGTPSLEDLEKTDKSSSSAVPVYGDNEAVERKKADEEEAPPVEVRSQALTVPEPPATFAEFKQAYPPKSLDAAKAKSIFEALSYEKKRKCIERLHVYRGSPRWQKSPQFIPLASNWLKSDYEEPPPPYFEAAGDVKKGFTESVMEEAQRRFNKWGEVT